MEVYRIVQSRFAEDISGEGAKRYGGRWNQKESACLYTSGSRALAALELLVHLITNSMQVTLTLLTISVPEKISHHWQAHDLPPTWREVAEDTDAQRLGSQWLRSQSSLGLGVPSIIIPQEFNYLINPSHPGFENVKITGQERFDYDARLLSPFPAATRH